MGKDKKKRKHHNDESSGDEADAHRSQKSSAKKAAKVAKMLGYTNDTNPFGDSNLLQPFVWGKKVAKDREEGKSSDKDTEGKRLQLLQDISRVRKRREEREKELEEMERLRTEEQRLREAALYGDWQQKEEDFHLEQYRVRSKLRLIDHREQPIDILAKNILLLDSSTSESSLKSDRNDETLLQLDVEIRDPTTLVEKLDLAELDDLVDGIEGYLQLEMRNSGQYKDFWSSLKIIAVAERKKKSNADSLVHKSVKSDVESLLRGKNKSELDLLQSDMMKTIQEGNRGDVSYWEQMAHEVEIQRARMIVKECHEDLLRRQLQLLSQLRADTRSQKDEATETSQQVLRKGNDAKMTTDRQQQASAEDMEPGDSEENMNNESEVTLPGVTYWWQDKYRPRKPRYLNRVRTGWDWNKYNQTHYDHDNPPPKKIQGYKFTVFYPDLIDKTKTPKYFLEGAEEKEFAIIRFHAGAPYEDVAFKILNKEWETSRRSGFRCVFERGVLQLHFNFKRQFYRR